MCTVPPGTQLPPPSSSETSNKETKELLVFLREENEKNRSTVSDEAEANRKLLLDALKIVSIPLAVVIGIAGFLGFKSFSDLKSSLQDEARKEIKAEETQLQADIYQRLSDEFQKPTLQKMITSAAVDSTKAAAKPLIKSEVAQQVRTRVDAERGTISKAVTQETQAAVRDLAPKIDASVAQAVDANVKKQVEPVAKQMSELSDEAKFQALIMKMNADDAKAFDVLELMLSQNPRLERRQIIISELKSVIDSHNSGLYMTRSFNPPISDEERIKQLSSQEPYNRQAAIDSFAHQDLTVLHQLVVLAIGDPSLNVRSAATRLINGWTKQNLRCLESQPLRDWWQANKDKYDSN